MQEETVTIGLPDGGSIVGVVRSPSGPVRASVVVHPAVATPERFYGAVAESFTEAGFVVLSYDYRGVGRSGAARDLPHVRMRDWMSVDAPAAAAWLQQRHPDVPALAIGHSLGGHALSLGFASEGLTAFATVSSHAGVTARIPDRGERAKVRAFFAVGPVLTRVLGYGPSKLAGFGVDIPAGVLTEWARWTRQPEYFFTDPTLGAVERAAGVRLPVLVVGASDDPWATSEQIEAISTRMTSAAVERRTYTPADLGAARIGHHGLMRRGVGEPFWADLREWFLAQLS